MSSVSQITMSCNASVSDFMQNLLLTYKKKQTSLNGYKAQTDRAGEGNHDLLSTH